MHTLSNAKPTYTGHPMTDQQMIFLVGWFRSGTSMLWNLLRGTGLYYCYYEPFHELLPQLAYTPCKHEIDPTHSAIRDYWAEYRATPKSEFLEHWAPWYGRERWRMTKDDSASDMESYIRFLAARAPRPPVFKFVRAAFRVGWLRHNFPDARIIWLNRDPRKVWDSMQKRDSSNAATPGDPEITQQGFSNYILQMALELEFPIKEDLYATFYNMWSTSFLEAKNHVDDIWWYEDILTNYPDWAETNLVNTGLTKSIPPYGIRASILAHYTDKISRYLESELGQVQTSMSSSNHAMQRILEEIPSRNQEIVMLRSRILDLEAELCREKERQYISNCSILRLLREKFRKNLIKIKKFASKP